MRTTLTGEKDWLSEPFGKWWLILQMNIFGVSGVTAKS